MDGVHTAVPGAEVAPARLGGSGLAGNQAMGPREAGKRAASVKWVGAGEAVAVPGIEAAREPGDRGAVGEGVKAKGKASVKGLRFALTAAL